MTYVLHTASHRISLKYFFTEHMHNYKHKHKRIGRTIPLIFFILFSLGINISIYRRKKTKFFVRLVLMLISIRKIILIPIRKMSVLL